jgi:hypothetical protein
MTQTKVEAPFVANNFAHFKNLVINGDFRIFQRTASSTAIGNGTYSTADQFKTQFSNDGAGTTQQHTLSAADRATTGHHHAWQWDVGTADTSLAAGQLAYFRHFIEASNCSGLAYGSSAAKTLTLSFWVKSAKTGTYCCSVEKDDSTKYTLPLEYTISSADTWEHKTLVVSPTAGSTSLITGSDGGIAVNIGKGITLYWWLASGSDYTGGTNNTWSSNNNHLTTTNQVNWLDSTDNNFYITGIQFEIGDQATDFEHLPIDVQLQRCQRYYQQIPHTAATTWQAYPLWGVNANVMSTRLQLPVVMRAAPTGAFVGTRNTDFKAYYNGGYQTLTAESVADTTDDAVRFDMNSSGAFAANAAGGLYINTTDGRITLTAEL